MNIKSQRTILIAVIFWIILSCLGGISIGIIAAPKIYPIKKNNITQIFELNVTQIVGGPTYTPFPTYTIPPSPSPTQTIPVYIPHKISTITIPVPTLTPTPENIKLLTFSWNVIAGEAAFIKVRITPATKCLIQYIDPKNEIINATELTAQIADQNGECYWRWTIDENSPIGTGTVIVEANNTSQTFLMQISKEEE